MNEASLVDAVERNVVTLADVSVQESSPKPLSQAPEDVRVNARAPGLARALAISIGVALLLGGIAFWPSKSETLAPRPTLKAPIVFDVLNSAPLPQGSANTGPPAPESLPSNGEK